jgi:hypothetical protein
MAYGSIKRITHGWQLTEAAIHFEPDFEYDLSDFRTGFDWADAAQANALIEAVAERCNARLPVDSAWEFDYAVVGVDATDADYFAQLQEAVQIAFLSYLHPEPVDERDSWGYRSFNNEWSSAEQWKQFCQKAGLAEGEHHGFRYARDVDGDGNADTAYPDSARLCQTGDLMQCPGGCGYLLDDLLDALDMLETVVLASPETNTWGRKFAWASDSTMNVGDGETKDEENEYDGDVDKNLASAIGNFVEELSTHDGAPWAYAETHQTYKVGVGDGEGDTMDIILVSTFAQGEIDADVGLGGSYVVYGQADLAEGADTYKDYGANVPTDELGPIGSGVLDEGKNSIFIGRATMDTDEFEADNPFLELRTKVEPKYTRVVVGEGEDYEWYVSNAPEGRVERKGWFPHPGGNDEGYFNAEWEWSGDLSGNDSFSAGPASFGEGSYTSSIAGDWNGLAAAEGSALLAVTENPCDIEENEDCEDPDEDLICTADDPDHRCPNGPCEDDPCEGDPGDGDPGACTDEVCDDRPWDTPCSEMPRDFECTELPEDWGGCSEWPTDFEVPCNEEPRDLGCDEGGNEVENCEDPTCDQFYAEPDPCDNPDCDIDENETVPCDNEPCDLGDPCEVDPCESAPCEDDQCEGDPGEDCDNPDCDIDLDESGCTIYDCEDYQYDG